MSERLSQLSLAEDFFWVLLLITCLVLALTIIAFSFVGLLGIPFLLLWLYAWEAVRYFTREIERLEKVPE